MSYIDTTKIATDDVLVAMTSNVKQIVHKPTHDPQNSMTGSISFERIHPRSSHFSVSDIKIFFKGTFTLTYTTAFAANVLPSIRLENINAALYAAQIDMNGSVSFQTEPYINYLIKKQYDKDYYQEEQQLKHDKYVFSKISIDQTSETTRKKVVIKYECMSPFMAPEFDTDLTGLSNFNIQSQVNLYNLIKLQDLGTLDTIELTNAEYEIRYNEIQNTIPQESYNTMINHYYYYSGVTGQKSYTANTETETETAFNIKDVNGQPLIVYVVNAPNIKTEHDKNIFLVPEIYPTSCTFDINSDTNSLLTTSTHSIYEVSKSAGLITEYNTWAGQADNYITTSTSKKGIPCPPVIACNMLKTANSSISTNDLFRLNVDVSYKYTYPVNKANYKPNVYSVYMYPSLLIFSPTQCTIFKNLPQTFNECVEMEDDEAYFRQLANSGVLEGGGKVGDFFKNLWRKIKSGKFISKALKFIGNTKGANNLISMIPGVSAAMPIIEKIQDISGNLGTKAEDAGYGVNMF